MSQDRLWMKLGVMASMALGFSAAGANAGTVLDWDFQSGYVSPPIYSTYPSGPGIADVSGNSITGVTTTTDPGAFVPGAYAGSTGFNLNDGAPGDGIGAVIVARRIGVDPFVAFDSNNPSANVDPKFAEIVPGKNSFTMEMFVKAPSAITAPFGYGYLANLMGSNTTETQIALEMKPNGTITFVANARGDDPMNNFTTSTAINNDQWHHLAIVRDAAGQTIKYYVDYNLVDTVANDPNGTAPLPGDPNTTYDSGDFSAFSAKGDEWTGGLTLGALWPGTKSYGADWASIDDFRISNTALAPSQFINSPIQVPEPASVGLLLSGAAMLVLRRRRS